MNEIVPLQRFLGYTEPGLGLTVKANKHGLHLQPSQFMNEYEQPTPCKHEESPS